MTTRTHGWVLIYDPRSELWYTQSLLRIAGGLVVLALVAVAGTLGVALLRSVFDPRLDR